MSERAIRVHPIRDPPAALVTFLATATLGAGRLPAGPRRAATPALQLVDTFVTAVHARAPGAASSGLLFVIEDEGTIRIVDHGTTLEPLPRYSHLVEHTDQGLLSIAFAPDYETSGRFYVFFTNNNGNIEIDEFAVSPTDPTDADESTRPQGDRHLPSGAPEPRWRPAPVRSRRDALDVDRRRRRSRRSRTRTRRTSTTLLGKLLRIDPRVSGSDSYTVPPDNPFVGLPGRDEIWSSRLAKPVAVLLRRQPDRDRRRRGRLLGGGQLRDHRDLAGCELRLGQLRGHPSVRGAGADRARAPIHRVLERHREARTARS